MGERVKQYTSQEQLKARNMEAVAVYPWVVAMPDRILQDLHGGNDPDVLRVLMGQKPDTGSIASSMITPIREEVKNGKSIFQTAYNGVRGDTTLFTVPLTHEAAQSELQPLTFIADEPMEFTIGEQNRRLTVAAIPVLPPRLAHGHDTSSLEQEGLERIIPFRLSELETTFKTGEYKGSRVVESSTQIPLPPDGPVKFESQAADQMRLDSLDNLIQYFHQNAHYIEERIVGQIGTFEPGTTLKQVYEFLKERFPDAVDNTITRAVERVQDEIFFTAYKKESGGYAVPERELTPKELYGRLTVEMNSGSYGRDVLEAAAIESQRATPIVEGSTAVKTFTTFWDRLYLDAQEISNVTLDESPTQDKDLISKLDNTRKVSKTMVRELAKVTGKTPEQILRIYRESRSFFTYIGGFAETAFQGRDVYQVHEVRNEIQNANLATLLQMIHGETGDPVTRFEARRQLYIFTKYMIATDYYDEAVDHQNQEFSGAIDQFFGAATGKTLKLGDSKHLEVRRGQDGINRVVDFKDIKSKESFVRVSMEKPVEDIHDIYAYSIVQAQDFGNDIKTALKANGKTVEDFEAFLRETFPGTETAGYRLDIMKHKKEGVELLEQWIDSQEEGELLGVGSGRTGSKNELIVREKVLMKLTDPRGKEHFCEIAFYPFPRLAGKRPQLQEARAAGFMGWKEKIRDDRIYGLNRVTEDIKGAYGQRSLYEMLFPATLYRHVVTVRSERRAAQPDIPVMNRPLRRRENDIRERFESN